MWVKINEAKDYTVLRSSECRCRACGAQALVALVEERRTVSALLIFSETEVTHHLACSACKALFRVRRDWVADDRHAIPDLMEMVGRREFPLVIPLVFLVWIAVLPLPLAPLVVAWKQHSHRLYFGPGSAWLYRALLRLSVVLSLIWLVFIGMNILGAHRQPFTPG